MKYTLHAVKNCRYCHGSGTVYDTVDYGSTTAQMSSDCDCAFDQLPESFDDLTDDYEIIPVYEMAEETERVDDYDGD